MSMKTVKALSILSTCVLNGALLTSCSAESDDTAELMQEIVGNPYGGSLAAVPGRIQSENYDLGGSGVAYFDTTAGNSGGQYRSDGVDLEVSTQGGYNVGWTAAGEWLNYSVNVAASGTYKLRLSVASLSTGGSLHLEVDGVNVSGPVSFQATGGWQVWKVIEVADVRLTAGQKTIRLVVDSAGFNIDWFELLATSDPTCSTGILNDAGTACCPATCGACGGTGCDQRPGGAAACCTSGVTASGASCSSNFPPCVMDGGSGGSGGATSGNISPLLVGNNLWYNPDANVWNAVKPAGLKIVRIGGAAYDKSQPSNAQLATWVNNIKAMGAEPLIQVSQYRTAQEAADTVRYFNVTTGNKVKYWNIGNEPWLQRNKPAISTMGPIIAGYVKPLASAMKAVDPSIKVYAPDECEYFDELYNALLGGSSDITGKDANGRYYIDGISWHRYAETSSLASDMISRIQKTRQRVDYANTLHGRTGADALGFGIGEFNSNAGGGGPCTFANGQAAARTYGALMKYNGTYASLWSFKEGGSSCSGTDFGFLNGDNSPRPSYYHMQLISQNFAGTYADGKSNIGNLYAFGAFDSSKIVVMLINQGGAQTCNVRLNNDAVSGSCQVNIGASTAVTSSQAIGASTSMVLVFSRQGQLTKRITYASGSTPRTQTF